MRRVVIESPYAGDVGLNLLYLRACLADSLSRGEAPYASHAIYTQPGAPRQPSVGHREGIAAVRHGACAGMGVRGTGEGVRGRAEEDPRRERLLTAAPSAAIVLES
jgi:hypothetical protein